MTTTRRRRRPAEARALVLRTVEARLAKDGPGAFSLLDVAEQSGLAHSTILHHFGSVEALKGAVTQHILERVLKDAIAILQPEQPQVLTIDRIIALFMEQMDNDETGHLLSWLVLNPVDHENWTGDQASAISQHLQELAAIADERVRLGPEENVLVSTNDNLSQGQAVILMVGTSLIGHLLVGSFLGRALGLPQAGYKQAYVGWLSDLVAALVGVDPAVREVRKKQTEE